MKAIIDNIKIGDIKDIKYNKSYYEQNCINIKSENIGEYFNQIVNYNKYGKEYNVKHFFIRNEAIIKYSDGVVAFVKDKEITSGTQNAVNHAKKHKKKVVFISWYIYIYIYMNGVTYVKQINIG